MVERDRAAVKPLVLVADDDPTIRQLARAALEQDGLEVRTVADGAAAEETFARDRPALVMLDVMMPGVDGLSVCRWLRERESGRHTPVLMLTSLDDLASVRRAYEVGATDFVTKPVNWQILRHRVRYMLRASSTLEALHQSEERFTQLAENLDEAFWISSADGARILYVSPPFERIWGVPRAALSERPGAWLEAVHAADRPQVEAALQWPPSAAVELEYRILRPDGVERWIRDRRFPIRDVSGAVYRVAGIAEDVTARHESDEQIRYMAFFDTLTGLPNRASFKRRLGEALRRAQRGGRAGAVLFLDLDHFKRINDTLGHRVGDLLLEAVAERLRACVRTTDFLARGASTESLTIARLGGDEFTAVLEGLHDGGEVARVAQRIRKSLSQPFQIDGHEIYATASIGATIFPADGADVDTLLKNADTAMYAVKERGRNGFLAYSGAIAHPSLDQMRLEHELRKALEAQELELFYQPQLDAFTGQIVGMEALLRWRHPERGVVAPGEFVSLLEESGLIVPVGEWVLRTACAQCQAWRQEGLPVPRVSVNLSARQFREPRLVEMVRDVLTATRLPAEALELELTESIVMHDVANTISTLHRLRRLGVRLAVDDFGTGYSSLSYLKRFPINLLKVDRSFVRDLAHDRDDEAIVAAIIALCRSLGLGVIAEGVETEEQCAFLKQHGCFEMQGNLFGQPVPAAEATELLRRPRVPAAPRGEVCTTLSLGPARMPVAAQVGPTSLALPVVGR